VTPTWCRGDTKEEESREGENHESPLSVRPGAHLGKDKLHS
jgi:hypothetical protein